MFQGPFNTHKHIHPYENNKQISDQSIWVWFYWAKLDLGPFSNPGISDERWIWPIFVGRNGI